MVEERQNTKGEDGGRGAKRRENEGGGTRGGGGLATGVICSVQSKMAGAFPNLP